MRSDDALFFHQLLFPMCDPQRSGIRGDPRAPFYSIVEKFCNKYCADLGLGGAYGHSFKQVKLDELVHFDGVVIRDGVRGGSNGAIYRRWIPECCDYDVAVTKSMCHTRWLQIKRVCLVMMDITLHSNMILYIVPW